MTTEKQNYKQQLEKFQYGGQFFKTLSYPYLTGTRRISSCEVQETGAMGDTGNSAAVYAVEEAAISGDAAAAVEQECNESNVCGVANGSIILGRGLAAAAEYPPPMEMLCVQEVV